jgi:chemotaxis protein methyltransferase WspC
MAQIDFENLLKEVMGLDSASVGSATIERAVRLRMASAGVDQKEDYWQQLRSSKAELQEFIEAVVVPETWFFRDPEAFAALVRLAVEEWRPSAPMTVLRLLSIPCSTGEEPYSIVMALLDGGFSPEQIQVDAVDISARALFRAKHGVYGSNSFRGQNMAFRERYFRLTENGYAMAESVVHRVNFRQGNLLADDLNLDERPYDVVFCRNVLIYFDRATQEQAMRRLGSFLAPSGLLFVGPAEAFLASCNGFVSVNQAMSFAFRRNPTKGLPPSVASLPAPVKPLRTKLLPQGQRPAKVEVPVSAPAALAPRLDDLRTASSLADAGRLQEASAVCESHLRRHGPSAEAYYLLSLVQDAMGIWQDAAESYRKTLYLEPDHVEALMHLALLTENHGEVAAAGRLRERARRADRTSESRKP